MPVPRSLLPLLLAGPLALPGCVLPVVATSTGPVPAAKPTAPAPAPERFAEFVTAPGQRVPLTEARPAPVVAHHTAPVEPPPGAVARPDPPADTGTMQTAGVGPLLTGQPVGRQTADPPVLAALRAHLDDRPAAAADHLKGLPRDSQQLLAHLLPAAAAAGRGAPNGAVVSRHVTAAAEVVDSTAPLAVRKALFVEKLRKYGDYDPLPADYQFLPGSGTQALLYLELVHPPPQIPTDHPTGGRGYVIRLDARTRILDAAGRPVTQTDPDTRRPREELTFQLSELPRSPVRDYYCTFAVTLPARPGRYQITVELCNPDDKSRPAAVTVPFQVGG